MPRAPRRCAVRDCPNLTRTGNRCAEHRTPGSGWEANPSPSATTRDRSTFRRRVLAGNPPCALCGQPATIADHITPIAQGGTNDPGNGQPLCKPCHDAKTKREAAAGRRRAAGQGSPPAGYTVPPKARQ